MASLGPLHQGLSRAVIKVLARTLIIFRHHWGGLRSLLWLLQFCHVGLTTHGSLLPASHSNRAEMVARWKPPSYNLIAEVTSHPFCHSRSLGESHHVQPHRKAEDQTRERIPRVIIRSCFSTWQNQCLVHLVH